MPDGGETTLQAAVERWLRAFEVALDAPDVSVLRRLFHDDSHWRDLLALTWDYTSVSGADTLVTALREKQRAMRAHRFRIDPARTMPRRVTRVGTQVIEAIFAFDTVVGTGSGVLRLSADANAAGALKAWTLLTTLDTLRGHEEQLDKNRPRGESYARDFNGPNWLDQRDAARAYADRDPAVLVVGGGQAGLSIAARLTQLQVDTLIVDREARIGDNWRKRYHALTLHNQVHVNHLPYMPFPPNWPTYIPKDKLANWFEGYVEAMELNFWTGTEFVGGSYDDARACWTVTLRRADGSTRTMHPRHVVMAPGVSGLPIRPHIPTLDHFAGVVVHSSEYEDGEPWRGKHALVLGSGNSAHDIAQDLHASGAKVTMVQRSPTLIVSVEPSGQLAYALYDEGPPLADCDLLASAMPWSLVWKAHALLAEVALRHDRPLLDRLQAVGFELEYGEDGRGWQYKYLTRGGGYYFDVGCSELIASRAIGLVHNRDIAQFEPDGVRMRDGSHQPADLIVLATGFQGQDALVRKLFGAAVADRIGPVWGFGQENELRNCYKRTAQPGLWFMIGSLAQSRINSKYLALQIKALEEGIISPAAGPTGCSHQ